MSTVETPGLASLEAGITNANLVFGRCAPVNEYLDGIAIETVPRSTQSIRQGLRLATERPRGFQNPETHIRANYGWDLVASKTIEAYRSVLG